VALFDTLIDNLEPDEIVAVLAHEVGHFKKKHIMQTMIISTLNTGLMLFILSLFLTSQSLSEAFGMGMVTIHTSLIFFGLLYTPVSLILSMALNSLSRKNEYQADAFAATQHQHPEALVNALKKLSRDNLSNLTPHPFYVFVNYSHPPLLARIHHLRQFNEAPKPAPS
jgi:STE24 endopeptidase